MISAPNDRSQRRGAANPLERPDSGARALRYLRTTDIFRDLSAGETEQVHHYFPMSICRRGTVFFHPGESSDRLYILKEGTVVLYRVTPEGKRIVVGTVKPGTVFGELALAGLTMRDSFAEAQEDSLVCEATRTDVERLLRDHPSVGFRLLEVLGRRVLELEQRIEEIAYRSVHARVAAVLIRWAEQRDGRWLVTGFTHEDLADTAAAARQTVSSTLRELEQRGVIRLGRRRIELLDYDGLAELGDAEAEANDGAVP